MFVCVVFWFAIRVHHFTHPNKFYNFFSSIKIVLVSWAYDV